MNAFKFVVVPANAGTQCVVAVASEIVSRSIPACRGDGVAIVSIYTRNIRSPRPIPDAPVRTVSRSGMSKTKKTLIYVGLAVGFAATVWTIDHNVLDITPSSLGTRKD